jgi:hypothetical protein
MGRYITTTLTYATTTVTTGISYAASVNDRVLCTAGGITITLPATSGLLVGDTVQIIDVTGVAGSSNITVARNGAEIQNVADDLTININNATVTLTYSGVTYGWVLS